MPTQSGSPGGSSDVVRVFIGASAPVIAGISVYVFVFN